MTFYPEQLAFEVGGVRLSDLAPLLDGAVPLCTFVNSAADAVTWVVGFAMIADRYGPLERGRVSGIVMSGTSAATA